MVSLIATIAIFAFIALAGFFGYMKGHKYIWQYSVVKTVLFLVSAVLSVILAKILGKVIVDVVMGILPEDILEVLGSVSDVASALVLMIITPIIFYPVFIIIKFIAYRFIKLLTLLLVKLLKHEKNLNDVSGFEGSKRKKKMMIFNTSSLQ